MRGTSVSRQIIESAINEVRSQSGRSPVVMRDSDSLTGELSLDSLDLAAVVVRLEQKLGVDPFREIASPTTTFGELVTVYDTALGGDEV